MSRISFMLAAAVMLAAMIVAPTPRAEANGTHVLWYQGPAGPYSVRVQGTPGVGNVHMIISVSTPSGLGAVNDAQAEVRASGPAPSSQSVGPVSATPTLTPGEYQVSLPIAEPGEWVFTLILRGPLGQGTAEFPARVQAGGSVSSTFIGLVIGVVLVGVGAWWLRRPSRQQGRGKRRPNNR